jgi:hypothetical protein
MDKLREENQAMREAINKACCPSCGLATTSRDGEITTEEQQLRIENASLRAEVCTINDIKFICSDFIPWSNMQQEVLT